jgi:hypothetical protein
MLLVLLVLGGLLVAPLSCHALKPHLVFFLADDYGFADVEYHTKMYGHDKNVIHTPNLDALSAQGCRLENYYVQPVCSPTRSTIMYTGRSSRLLLPLPCQPPCPASLSRLPLLAVPGPGATSSTLASTPRSRTPSRTCCPSRR